MMKHKIGKRPAAAIFCIALIILTACGGTASGISASADDTNPSDTAGAAPAAPRSGLSPAAAAADFGLRMFRQSMDTGENILLSPASVLFALGMTANGAEENTLAQFEAVFGISIDELNRYLYTVRQSLPAEENCRVTSANSIWFRDDPDLSVLPGFLQLNTDYYAADIFRASFDNSTKTAINDWVSRNTDGMIDRILDEIPPEAVMYLINAMAFDAKWMNPYHEGDIKKGDFTKEDGSVLNVDFMYSEEQKYLEEENASGFLKYYDGGRYAFAALLPEEGISIKDYVSSLTGEKLNHILNSPTDIKVYASIPKFEAEYSAELADLLYAMGISDAFDPERADFSGLASYTGANLFINHVLHKTYICVDEEGTKAAAVTAVAVQKNALCLEEPEFKVVYLDRPFVYLLIDCEEGFPIFIGTIREFS